MQLEVRVQSDGFDLAQEESELALRCTDAGAQVAFVGRVRAHDGPVALARLYLEHYPGVTEAEVRRIAGEAAARWPLLGVRVVHRVGLLAPGEAIVLVLVAAAHRQIAFSAAEFLMDYLKTQAPFWKREDFIDGSRRWVEPRESDAEARLRWQSPGPATGGDAG